MTGLEVAREELEVYEVIWFGRVVVVLMKSEWIEVLDYFWSLVI